MVYAEFNPRDLFQFHLVRLKPRRGGQHGAAQTISIPPGPIEAGLPRVGQGANHLFQFHLVRLKLRELKRATAVVNNFNSTWSD